VITNEMIQMLQNGHARGCEVALDLSGQVESNPSQTFSVPVPLKWLQLCLHRRRCCPAKVALIRTLAPWALQHRHRRPPSSQSRTSQHHQAPPSLSSTQHPLVYDIQNKDSKTLIVSKMATTGTVREQLNEMGFPVPLQDTAFEMLGMDAASTNPDDVTQAIV
jgi:hypothetical protein